MEYAMAFPKHTAAVLSLLALSSVTHAAPLLVTGYAQNFDGMGTGTTPPTDWSVWAGVDATSNATWITSITANGADSVQSMILAPTPLVVSSAPTGNSNNGYNAARTASTLADRVLATAPTTISGSALQLVLTNFTGAALSGLSLSFDTVRFTAAPSANQLPGYWLFYSTDGSTWNNVLANPTIATVPNTVGVTPTSSSFNFAAPVADGATFRLRWVDDNAQQTSPDQIIGLNNVSITGIGSGIAVIPVPGALPLMLAGLAVIGVFGRRRVQAPAV
jgi:hypothetical protein